MIGEDDDWARQDSCDDRGEPDEAERKAAEFEQRAREQGKAEKQPTDDAKQKRRSEGSQ